MNRLCLYRVNICYNYVLTLFLQLTSMFVFLMFFLSCLLCNNPFSNNHVRFLLIPIFLKSGKVVTILYTYF
jgi:hypothetical protein